jgi:hypothetical protein
MALLNSINPLSSATSATRSPDLYLFPVPASKKPNDATVIAPSDTSSSEGHLLSDREVFALLTQMVQAVMNTMSDKSSVLANQGLNQQQTLNMLTELSQSLTDTFNAQLAAAAAAVKEAQNASLGMRIGMFVLQLLIVVVMVVSQNYVGAAFLLVTAILTTMPIDSSGGTALDATAKALFPNDEKAQKIFSIVMQVVLAVVAIGAGAVAGVRAAGAAATGAFGDAAAATMASASTVMGSTALAGLLGISAQVAAVGIRTAVQVACMVVIQTLFSTGAIQKIVQSIVEMSTTDETKRMAWEMVFSIAFSLLVIIGGSALASKIGGSVTAGSLMAEADSTCTSKLANILNSLAKVMHKWYIPQIGVAASLPVSVGFEIAGGVATLKLSGIQMDEGTTKGSLDLTTTIAQMISQAEQRTAQEGTEAIEHLATTINVNALTAASQALSQAV